MRDAPVRDLRIGFIVSSGEVLLPIETSGDPRFVEPAWRLRVRTTRESSDFVHAPASSHERDDERADSGVHRPGVVRLADPVPWQANDWAREHSPNPVLIDLGADSVVKPPILAVDDDLPASLRSELAAADLLKGQNRSLRAGPIWVVYGARTFDAQRRMVGGIRSIWLQSNGRYHLRHTTTTNPTFEGMMRKWMSEQSHAYRAHSFVGQVHALLAHAGQLFLLTRTVGWESDLVTLGQLGDGTLDPVLIDGLDSGC